MAECCLAIQVIDSKRYATKLLIIRCLWMSRSSDSKFSRLANLNGILEERRQRIHLPAVQAARRIEARAALRANALSGEDIKTAAATGANPEISGWRSGVAGWTRQTGMAGSGFEASKQPRLLQSTPTLNQRKRSHDAQPRSADGEKQQQNHRDHANRGGDQQAFGATENVPK